MAEEKNMQPVVRVVRESTFVHCYLKCGHLITVHQDNPTEKPPSLIECWACEIEAESKKANEERFRLRIRRR